MQSPPPLCKLGELSHLRGADAILHKFRYGGLHLMDIPDFIQIFPDNRHLLLQRSRHLPQHQALSGIVQNGLTSIAGFLKNTVGKPSEAQHVNIHNRMARMLHHKVHLGLHGELVGHDQQIVFLRAADGFLNDIVMQFSALSGAGSAKVKL